MYLWKISFSYSPNVRLPASVLTGAISRSSRWEMFCKKGVLFRHVSMIWTLVDLIYTKRLFSQETAFFSPDYFTRDKNGFILQRFMCSHAINKVKTSTLCKILNYSTEHLKVPGNCRQPFVKNRKEKCHFLRKRANTTKEYHCIIPGNYVNFYHNICLLCQGASSLSSNYNPEHVNISQQKANF